MNEKIKTILEKHINDLGEELTDNPTHLESINSAIIEICEEQMDECAKPFYLGSDEFTKVVYSKNIAE